MDDGEETVASGTVCFSQYVFCTFFGPQVSMFTRGRLKHPLRLLRHPMRQSVLIEYCIISFVPGCATFCTIKIVCLSCHCIPHFFHLHHHCSLSVLQSPVCSENTGFGGHASSSSTTCILEQLTEARAKEIQTCIFLYLLYGCK